MNPRRAILGISCYYHDSAAALLVDGEVAAAAQEERFTRIKHDPSFPKHAVEYVLAEAGVPIDRCEAVAFYEKPFVKFERLLHTSHAFAPKGLSGFIASMPVWVKEKLFMKDILRKELRKLGADSPVLLFPEHHVSHAASAFYPSPFDEAAILTLDGVGEWASATIGFGQNSRIKLLRELSFPHSLGLLYSAFTAYCGFRVNSGEYKLMGLAPYGRRDSEYGKFKETILNDLIDIREDGSFLLNMRYFDFATGNSMYNERKWRKLFGISPRLPDEERIAQSYMNMALAIQDVTEEIALKLAATAKAVTGSQNLVLAGGVALNCVANAKLLNSKLFENIWIQPAAGDAGGALGAALSAWHIHKDNPRTPQRFNVYLGPGYDNRAVSHMAGNNGATYTEFKDTNELLDKTADLLSEGTVVGWFQGRMEFGPRALGNRSILADPRNPDMQKKLNLQIKFREGFRPFAPSVLLEKAPEIFDLDRPSPYMLFVAPVRENRRLPLPPDYDNLPLYERLYHKRSDLPAITHIDFSARVQTVDRQENEMYWKLLKAFEQKTGCPVLVNTSFNVRGEPIVCTPSDAYRCFMRTDMDALVIGNFLFLKQEQPAVDIDNDRQVDFEPD
ncbi:MAG: carbamoyltransferase [Chitinispirillales bacterium]|jgi:carbamoyltransferase|nr:carbamoyltransferase [Chitinispirillales bacterium]